MNSHDVLVPSTPISPNVSITVPSNKTSNAPSPCCGKTISFPVNRGATVGATPKKSWNSSCLLRYKN